jgi:hypothetical protein
VTHHFLDSANKLVIVLKASTFDSDNNAATACDTMSTIVTKFDEFNTYMHQEIHSTLQPKCQSSLSFPRTFTTHV